MTELEWKKLRRFAEDAHPVYQMWDRHTSKYDPGILFERFRGYYHATMPVVSHYAKNSDRLE